VDAFGDLIRGLRAHGSLFSSTTLSPPWALHFVDEAPLTLCTVLGGAGWIVFEAHPPVRICAWETVVVRGPEVFVFVDKLDTAAEPVTCGELCTSPSEGWARHRRGWHDPGDATGTATLIVGAYPTQGEINRRLLDALPTALRVPSGGTGDAVVDHLAAEVAIGARAAVRARPVAGLDAGLHAAHVVRPGRRRAAGVVGGTAGPGRRRGPEPAARGADGAGAVAVLADRAGVARSTVDARQAVHRPGRRTTNAYLTRGA